jgi:hypothetical protein
LLNILPEVVLKQLPCFDGKGFGEVFGIVELCPFTLFRNEMIFCWMDSKSAMPLPDRCFANN